MHIKKTWPFGKKISIDMRDDEHAVDPISFGDPASIDRRFMLGKSPVSLGRYTYGFLPQNVYHWDQGAALHIGGFCSLAPDVAILLGGEHQTDKIATYPFGHHPTNEKSGWQAPVTDAAYSKGDVRIGNDVWIGLGATVMSGVTVGDGAVIAAYSHVFKTVEPYEIVGGNPSRTIRFRFDEEMRNLLLDLAWWTLPEDSIKEITTTLYCERPTKELVLSLINRYRGRRPIVD